MIDWRAAYTWGCADLTTPSPDNRNNVRCEQRSDTSLKSASQHVLDRPSGLAISLRRVLNFIVCRMQDGSLENMKTHFNWSGARMSLLLVQKNILNKGSAKSFVSLAARTKSGK